MQFRVTFTPHINVLSSGFYSKVEDVKRLSFSDFFVARQLSDSHHPQATRRWLERKSWTSLFLFSVLELRCGDFSSSLYSHIVGIKKEIWRSKHWTKKSRTLHRQDTTSRNLGNHYWPPNITVLGHLINSNNKKFASCNYMNCVQWKLKKMQWPPSSCVHEEYFFF